MSDYIKREDAIKGLEMLIEPVERDEHDVIWNDGVKGCINDIKHHTPSADVVEVRHGHWEQEQPQYRLYKCSVCNKVCFVERWGDKTVLYDYCPNCGAYMRMTKEQYESHVGDIYEDGEEE